MLSINPAFPASTALAGGRPSADANQQDQQLRATCHEFEAVLTGIIFKEGLKSSQQMNDEQEDGGSNQFMGMAYDQLADFTARQGVTGLGQQLYEQLKSRTSNGVARHVPE